MKRMSHFKSVECYICRVQLPLTSKGGNMWNNNQSFITCTKLKIIIQIIHLHPYHVFTYLFGRSWAYHLRFTSFSCVCWRRTSFFLTRFGHSPQHSARETPVTGKHQTRLRLPALVIHRLCSVVLTQNKTSIAVTCFTLGKLNDRKCMSSRQIHQPILFRLRSVMPL